MDAYDPTKPFQPPTLYVSVDLVKWLDLGLGLLMARDCAFEDCAVRFKRLHAHSVATPLLVYLAEKR